MSTTTERLARVTKMANDVVAQMEKAFDKADRSGDPDDWNHVVEGYEEFEDLSRNWMRISKTAAVEMRKLETYARDLKKDAEKLQEEDESYYTPR